MNSNKDTDYAFDSNPYNAKQSRNSCSARSRRLRYFQLNGIWLLRRAQYSPCTQILSPARTAFNRSLRNELDMGPAMKVAHSSPVELHSQDIWNTARKCFLRAILKPKWRVRTVVSSSSPMNHNCSWGLQPCWLSCTRSLFNSLVIVWHAIDALACDTTSSVFLQKCSVLYLLSGSSLVLVSSSLSSGVPSVYQKKHSLFVLKKV